MGVESAEDVGRSKAVSRPRAADANRATWNSKQQGEDEGFYETTAKLRDRHRNGRSQVTSARLERDQEGW